MIIENAYDTTFGSLISVDKIEKELIRYLTLNKDNLAYEFMNDTDSDVRSKLVFITGYNEQEKDLPLFDHVLVMEDLNKTKLIISDVRKYVKATDEISHTLGMIAKDRNSLDFITTRAMITRDFVIGDIGKFRSVNKSILASMSAWLGTAVGAIVGLDQVEKTYAEVVISHYISMMMIPEDDVKSSIDNVRARLSKSNYSLKISPKIINEILGNLNDSVEDVKDLIVNLKTVLPESKAGFITLDGLVSSISNTWFGHGNAETLIISLEHIPTFMALSYVSMENKSYKRTQFASILEKNKRMIGSTEYVKFMELYVKENTF